MLWCPEPTKLVVVDLENKVSLEIEDFWLLAEKKKQLMPQIALSNREGKRLFGLGYDNSTGYFIYQGRGAQAAAQFPSNIGLTVCLTADLSYNEDFIYIGGVCKDIPSISLVRFDESFKILSNIKFSKAKSNSVSKLKRIDGTDILMVGLNYEIAVVTHRAEDYELQQIYMYQIQGELDVCAMAFHSRYLYYIRSFTPELAVIEFEAAVNQVQFFLTGTPCSPETRGTFEPLKKLPDVLPVVESESALTTSPGTNSVSTNRELLAYLIEDDGRRIKCLFEEENKVEKRLKNALMIARKVISGARVTGMIGSQSLFVAGTSGNVETYSIQAMDLVPMKPIASTAR